MRPTDFFSPQTAPCADDNINPYDVLNSNQHSHKNSSSPNKELMMWIWKERTTTLFNIIDTYSRICILPLYGFWMNKPLRALLVNRPPVSEFSFSWLFGIFSGRPGETRCHDDRQFAHTFRQFRAPKNPISRNSFPVLARRPKCAMLTVMKLTTTTTTKSTIWRNNIIHSSYKYLK